MSNEKPKRMTRAQLYQCYARGLLECSIGNNHANGMQSICDSVRNDEVHSWQFCRPWNTDEWLEPTVDLIKPEWGIL